MTSYINIKKLKRLALVLGNQLFPIDHQNIDKNTAEFTRTSAFVIFCFGKRKTYGNERGYTDYPEKR